MYGHVRIVDSCREAKQPTIMRHDMPLYPSHCLIYVVRNDMFALLVPLRNSCYLTVSTDGSIDTAKATDISLISECGGVQWSIEHWALSIEHWHPESTDLAGNGSGWIESNGRKVGNPQIAHPRQTYKVTMSAGPCLTPFVVCLMRFINKRPASSLPCCFPSFSIPPLACMQHRRGHGPWCNTHQGLIHDE